MSNVTLFKNIRAKTDGQDYGIEQVFEWITSGGWQEKVELVRKSKNKEDRRNKKKDVPYFTASGTFKVREADGLVKHSGVIAIDFDELEDPNEAKSWLALDRFSWFTCLSISGKGLVVFVKIQGDKHLECFNFLQEYYAQTYNLVIDKSCKDIPRARFVTFDPDAIKNDNAETLVIEEEKQFDPERVITQIEGRIMSAQDGERHHTLLRQSILAGGYIAGNLIEEHEVTNRIELAFIATPYDEKYNYKKTIQDGINNGKTRPITIELYKSTAKNNSRVSRAVKELKYLVREQHRKGVNLNEEELKIICQRLELNYDRAEKIVNEIYQDEAEFFAFDKKNVAIKAKILIDKQFEFRNNIVKQAIDFREKGSSEQFKPISFEDVWLYVQERTSSKVSIDNIKNLLRSSWVEEYDPFLQYFENLEPWDGKTDYIGQLAEHVKTNNQPFWADMLKKHLVRSVGCSLAKKINRYVLVLVGEKQATGKSTFIRFLNPFDNGLYYTEAKLRGDKDSLFAMAENFVYNLEELSEMSKHDVNHVKALISQWSINERKPYAHSATTSFRRCNFFGSTNNAQFLTDTENTRWLCFEVNSINWGYSKIDINKIWAQAFALYNGQFDAELNKDQNEVQRKANKSYEVSDPGKDLIAKHFKPTKERGGESVFYSVADIIEQLINATDGKIRFNERIIGRNLKQLGFISGKQYVNGNQVRGYWAIKITGHYSDNNVEGPSIDEEAPF